MVHHAREQQTGGRPAASIAALAGATLLRARPQQRRLAERLLPCSVTASSGSGRMVATQLLAWGLALIASETAAAAAAARPNIVMLLTDDLDLMLGGMDSVHQPTHIPALRRRGAEVRNWFCHTPVCCPSRSEIITGKFFHNLAFTGGDRWNTDGHGHPQQCMYINETNLSPGPTFAEHLGAAGYAVGLFGKYLNLSPRSGSDSPEPWSTGPGNANPVAAPTGVHTYFVNPGPMAGCSPKACTHWVDPSGEYYPFWFLLGSPGFNGTFQNGNCPANKSAIASPADCPGMLYETDLLARHATQWLYPHTCIPAHI